MLLRTWMIMWKELIQISRDPRLLGIVVVLPLFMITLYGYAINLDVRHVRLAVYDQDRTRASRDLINTFTRSSYFDLVAYPSSYDAAGALLDGARARIVLVIPRRFADALAHGRVTQVQVLVDGSDSTTANTALGYIAQVVQQYSAGVTVRALHRAGITGGTALPIDNRLRYWYNPELRSNYFTIPGLIAAILNILAALLTSVTVVRERERGTLEQLLVSPVRPLELMLGKITPYIIIAFCDVLLVMGMSRFVFHVPINGNPYLVLVLSSFFIIAALGIGLFISTVAPSQQVAMMAAIMATQLPTMLLSGFIFPISSMPKFVQAISQIIPATHFIRILRGIFLKGNDITLLWKPALVLIILAVVMVALSANRFKKTL